MKLKFLTCLILMNPLQESGDVVGNLGSRVVARVSLHHVAVLVEKKLLKVPSDIRASDRGPRDHASSLEATTGKHQRIVVVAAIALGITRGIHGHLDGVADLLEEGVGISTIHLCLGIQVTSELEAITRADILEGVKHILIVLIRLVAELVAENTHNSQTGGLSNFIHCCEVLRGRASQSGNVLKQHHLTLVGVKLDITAGEILQSMIVKSHV